MKGPVLFIVNVDRLNISGIEVSKKPGSPQALIPIWISVCPGMQLVSH